MTVITLQADGAGRYTKIARGSARGLAILGAAFALTLAGPAEAQSGPLNNDQMAGEMHSYFHGEKNAGGPFFFGAGLAGVGIGTVMVVKGDDVTRGGGFPMIGLGLVQTIVGGALLLGTDKRVAKLDADLANDPAAFKRDETQRMDGVNTTFIALMAVESVLIAAGATTAVVTSQKDCCRTLKGVSIGLAAESAVTLLLDIFAYRRAQAYTDSLKRFDPSAGASPSMDGGGSAPMSIRSISFGGQF